MTKVAASKERVNCPVYEKTDLKQRPPKVVAFKEKVDDKKIYIIGRESKPRNSDFNPNDFLSTREYQTRGAHSVKFS